MIFEEHIVERFVLTAGECLAAGIMLTVFGVTIGVLCTGSTCFGAPTETWVAAFASAPLVLMYPLFLVIFGRIAWTIIMMGFVSGLPPVILKTIEGIVRHAPSAGQCRAQLQSHGRRSSSGKSCFPRRCRPSSSACGSGLIFALINIVGVEFLINFGGLGQLINDLAERYDLAGTYAAICFVILVSVLFFIVMERLERWLRPVD